MDNNENLQYDNPDELLKELGEAEQEEKNIQEQIIIINAGIDSYLVTVNETVKEAGIENKIIIRTDDRKKAEYKDYKYYVNDDVENSSFAVFIPKDTKRSAANPNGIMNMFKPADGSIQIHGIDDDDIEESCNFFSFVAISTSSSIKSRMSVASKTQLSSMSSSSIP
jgi:hypothetical protein